MKKHIRETTTRFYDEKSDVYLPAYPLIWNPSREIENRFAKHYDVIVESYCDKYNWLGLVELGFYNLLQTYARLGQTILLDEFVKKYHIGKHSLIKVIDRLSDCELLSRVTRVDHRGYPNDLVLRPPKAPSELIKGYSEFIDQNVRNNKTAHFRKESRDSYCLMAAFSEKRITRALGRKAHLAIDFHEKCLQENHSFFLKNPGAGEMSQEHKDYAFSRMHRYCERKEIEYTENVQQAIYDILNHYGKKPIVFH